MADRHDPSEVLQEHCVGHASQSVRYYIKDMCCPMEERLIRATLQDIPGVDGLAFDLVGREVTVRHHLTALEPIVEALESIGMRPLPMHGTSPGASVPMLGLTARQKILLAISATAAMTAEGLVWSGLQESSPLIIGLVLASVATSGLPTLRKGYLALRSFTLNIHFLMSLAIVGAIFIGQWPEAAMVVVLFAVAETIESLSLQRVRRSVHGLLSLAPDVASVRQPDGNWDAMPADRIAVGEIIRIKPGECVPLDGVVVEGESSVNQAPITGESMPVEKRGGDTVFAGTVNEHGVLDIRVTVNSGSTALARIVRVIEETRSRQAPTQRFIDQFARWYTPIVVAIAFGIATLPPLAFGLPASPWIYKALVMLVIACPCALVISTPVTVMSGLTAAARRGILIKGGEFIEAGARITTIALDKTGTLTRGVPAVKSAEALAAARPDDLLVLAASLNMNSTHPLARAMRAAMPVGRMMRQVATPRRYRDAGCGATSAARLIISAIADCSTSMPARLMLSRWSGRSPRLRGCRPKARLRWRCSLKTGCWASLAWRMTYVRRLRRQSGSWLTKASTWLC